MTQVEKQMEKLNAKLAELNALIKSQQYSKQNWELVREAADGAVASYNQAVRLERYKALNTMTDRLPIIGLLEDLKAPALKLKPEVVNKNTKEVKFVLENINQPLRVDEFDSYTGKCANANWKNQLAYLHQEIVAYILKELDRSSSKNAVANEVRAAFGIEDVKLDSNGKLLTELQKLADMIVPGLEIKSSELAIMKMVAKVKFNRKTGRYEAGYVRIDEMCEYLAMALHHAYTNNAYVINHNGATGKLKEISDLPEEK